MNILSQLLNASNNVDTLALFIDKKSTELYDFLVCQKYSELVKFKQKIESELILSKYKYYKKLDFSQSKNSTFLLCLLDLAERFGLRTEFQQLFNLANRKNIQLPKRIIASSYFLTGITKLSDFSERIPQTLELLTESYLEEEDEEGIVFATLINFYKEVFYNFGFNNLDGVIAFRKELINYLNTPSFKFLFNEKIQSVLSFSLDNINVLYNKVQEVVDDLFQRKNISFNSNDFIIESNTNYAKELQLIGDSFMDMRNLSSQLYSFIANDEIFYSLQRGVKVLTEENQLLAYLHSYGKMHYHKNMSAFKAVENENFGKSLDIIDWGCGQGLASVCFIEYLNQINANVSIGNITLIEPSEIALKRASLHVQKLSKQSNIKTVNKDLDRLVNKDFEIYSSNTKIHLFSNILDIDLFSMTTLIQNIKNNFNGLNYFICVSPYISVAKTQRIENFVDAFKNPIDFDLINEITELKGEWRGTNWTRVIRVFKMII